MIRMPKLNRTAKITMLGLAALGSTLFATNYIYEQGRKDCYQEMAYNRDNVYLPAIKMQSNQIALMKELNDKQWDILSYYSKNLKDLSMEERGVLAEKFLGLEDLAKKAERGKEDADKFAEKLTKMLQGTK